MSESKILYAIVIVSVLALVGRIIINRHKNNDSIKWSKLLAIATAVVAFVTTFLFFNPQRFIMWAEGEVSLDDSRTHSIAGRAAGRDISRFAGPSDDSGELYYALQVKAIAPTGYYRTKMPYGSELDFDRKVEETESEKEVIRHTTNVFPVTRTPGDRIDSYIPLYIAQLANKGSVLVAIPDYAVPSSVLVDSLSLPAATEGSSYVELPVAMLRSTDERLQNIVAKSDSTAIDSYYFIAFDELLYSQGQFNSYIYKGIAALLSAIIVAIVYLIFVKVNRRKATT